MELNTATYELIKTNLEEIIERNMNQGGSQREGKLVKVTKELRTDRQGVNVDTVITCDSEENHKKFKVNLYRTQHKKSW